MLKVRIRTKKPKYCIAKSDGVFRIRCVCRGKRGIKAFVDIKKKNSSSSIVIDEHGCPLAMKILETGAIVLSAEIEEEIVWNLACSDEAFRKLMEEVECELISKENFSEKDILTFREYTMLKFAFERGYFDSPKGVSLEDIAKAFQCSKSTTSETLRRALKKVLKSYFNVPI